MRTLFLLTLTAVGACGKYTPPAAPACIQAMIQDFENSPPENPPIVLSQWDYKGAAVYFLPATCCDVPSRLYDQSCKLLCNPDGGLTGKGDGRCADFLSARSHEVIVWTDPR